MNIKSILPLILLLVLGILAYTFMSGETKKKADTSDHDWVMHVENREDIERIFIADRKGGTADLKRDGEHWIYNDTYRANPHVMYNVLEVLTNVRMKNRPTSAAIPNMIKTLSNQSTKVEVYGKNDEVLKVFYIGGVTQDERGTFMILEGSNNPYIMTIPMSDVSLKTRFFTDVKRWRDKTVFEINPKNIASLSVEYPKRKNKSFKLFRMKGKWIVEPFFETTRKIEGTVKQDVVDSYLSEYKKKGAETLSKRTDRVERALMSTEFAIVKILFTDGTNEEVHFYPILEFADEDVDRPNTIEKYVAVTDKKDIFIIQHLVFQEIFWAYDFFF